MFSANKDKNFCPFACFYHSVEDSFKSDIYLSAKKLSCQLLLLIIDFEIYGVHILFFISGHTVSKSIK